MSTIDANSYGSIDEVVALTRLYLQGESSYNTTTVPTLTEVVTWVDKVSGVLNVALANAGFNTPISQFDVKSACDQWVVEKVAALVELSQPTAAFGELANPRAFYFQGLQQDAVTWVTGNEVGLKNLGVTVDDASSAAISFTGGTVQADRVDPDNTSLEQPFFKRRRFDS